jgi:hydrogenase maturation protein HypF
MAISTYHIHIQGIVQGVGFRPFVYNLANKYHLNGWVNNGVDGVHIEVNGSNETVEKLVKLIAQHAPPLSHITKLKTTQISFKEFQDFRIISSEESGNKSVLITPDYGICEACKEDINDVSNRRYSYPFTTCIHCGPRFSIIDKIPYDRPNTTMKDFEMCPACTEEYTNPNDRRYYSQTNSCADCGVDLIRLGKKKERISFATWKDDVMSAWSEGKIVAIKGIGGFLLTCDASSETAISNLRKRKNRPDKPLALMFPDLDTVKAYAKVSEFEQKQLVHPSAPIVLLTYQPGSIQTQLPIASIAPGLRKIGCMLAYTPLFLLVLNHYKKPIVATSGNISGSPILYEDVPAYAGLKPIADHVYTDNRRIVIPQDDSVLQFAHAAQQRIVLRRSRGLSPTVIPANLHLGHTQILALGGGLKSTFSISIHGNIYISQYLGDLENLHAQESFDRVLHHFFTLFDFKPEVILHDGHPSYHATLKAKELANELEIPSFSYQHHKAHFAAVLAENNLLHSSEPVLGIIWDGTGFGEDGNIWGGEFFTYENGTIQREHHLPVYKHLAADKMAREPRLAAMSIFNAFEDARSILKGKFSDTEWTIYQHLLQDEQHALYSSSMGRLFDAIASIIGIMDRSTYEGQAAMQLEEAARRFLKEKHPQGSYLTASGELDYSRIASDVKKEQSAEEIAARFHITLVDLIDFRAQKSQCKALAFSGGVFQNALLIDLIHDRLSAQYTLYFHQQFSPNDENISFGQLALYSNQL